jgi:outer membrane protein assembly factor BamB
VSTPSASAATTPLAPAVHAGDDWATYMGDAQRSGVGPATPATTNAHRTWTAQVDGDVFAAPLVAGSSVVVATEHDTVYALDAATGAARWHTHLGEPVPVRSLVCGNIDPNGITSTPVIDAAAGTVYAVAMLDAPIRHELFALRLSDGGVLWHHGADPPGADPRIHQQRGALSLVKGQIYITYGGFTGDCGQYHGWVLAAAADGSGSVHGWQVPSLSQGGIWAPPGAVVAASGDVWVATGNSEVVMPDRNSYDGGNAVLRLDAGLKAPADQWVASNWAALNNSDTDIGSMSPVLVGDRLVFMSGKPGIGYLLLADHLGGFGGEAFNGQACVTGGPTQGAFGGAAVNGSMVYLPCKDGLAGIAVDASKPSFTVLWHASTGANTPVVAYGLVWTVSADPAGYRQDWMGTLVGLDPATGAERARVTLGPTPHFPTPSPSRGSMYIAGRGTVYAVSVT